MEKMNSQKSVVGQESVARESLAAMLRIVKVELGRSSVLRCSRKEFLLGLYKHLNNVTMVLPLEQTEKNGMSL